MTELILKYIVVIVWSGIKYLVGFTLALASDFNFFEVLLTTVAGGMLGVVFYLYLWELIVKIKRKFFPSKTKTIRINKFTRFLVKIIKEYEIYGIAFLTPLVLTMPIGTVIASSIEHNKWRIKLFMFISLTFWTLLLYGLKQLLGFDIPGLIDRIF